MNKYQLAKSIEGEMKRQSEIVESQRILQLYKEQRGSCIPVDVLYEALKTVNKNTKKHYKRRQEGILKNIGLKYRV